MKLKKLLAGILSISMLATATAALAAAPSAYDGQTYESVGLSSDNDPDGEINLAVIANGDVNFTSNTLYVRGSIYSNGTIYVDDGGGNFTEGLLISGTGDKTYNLWDGTPVTFGGYQPVNDASLSDTQITGYSTQIDTNGSIYDANTEATYCGVNQAQGSLYDVPNTSGYNVIDSAYYGTWDVQTISANTYIGELTLYGGGLIVDVSNGDVNLVIDEFISAGEMPAIAVTGAETGNKLNLYINSYSCESGSDYFWAQINVNYNDYNIWSVPNAYGSVSRNDVADFDSWLETVNDYYGSYYYDTNAVNLYLSNGGEAVEIYGSKISANAYIDAPSVEIAGQAITKGDITTNATAFTTTGGASYVNGNVCAPYADADIVNSSVILGQVHINTLTCNGTGKIVYKADSLENEVTSTTPTQAPAATQAPTATQAPAATAAPAATPDTTTPDSNVSNADGTITLNVTPKIQYIKLADISQWGDTTLTFTTVVTNTKDENTNYNVTLESVTGSKNDANFTELSDTVGINAYSGYDASWNYIPECTQVWLKSNAYDLWQEGTVITLKVTSAADSSLYDYVQIVIGDEPVAADPTEAPAEPLPEGKEIDLRGVGYAYIFGYEPAISYVYDEETGGHLIAEIQMAPDDSVTREQVAAMIMRLLDQKYDTTSAQYPITDNIAKHDGTWYVRGLAYLASKGTFDGIDSVEVGAVTRGEVAKLVAYGLNLSNTTETAFTDIADNQYKTYIEVMAAYGYMNGVSDTEFEPNRVMTRAEFCAMFNNIIGRTDMGLEAADGTVVTPELYSIIDLNGHWAEETMLKATSAYDVNGYVDVETRLNNIRNILDNYDSQTWF